MKKTLILLTCLLMASITFAQTQIIAHRGFHAKEGSARNSLSALRNAQKAGFYGSECDINETSDGIPVVAHGPLHGTHTIQYTDIRTLRKQTLENGEILPFIDEYLKQAKNKPETKLIIEIKNHSTPQQETKLVKKVLDAVKRYKMQEHVEYIAFSQHVCNELVRQGPKEIKVAYLNGDLAPSRCKELGYSGIDYSLKVMKEHPEWIDECHGLGLTVNVWTVNKTEDIQWCIDQKVDFITTDNPEEVARIIEARK